VGNETGRAYQVNGLPREAIIAKVRSTPECRWAPLPDVHDRRAVG
jgi:hypothetical protein